MRYFRYSLLFFYFLNQVFAFSYGTLQIDKIFRSPLFADFDAESGRFFQDRKNKKRYFEFEKKKMVIRSRFDSEQENFLDSLRRERKVLFAGIRSRLVKKDVEIVELLRVLDQIALQKEQRNTYLQDLQFRYNREIDQACTGILYSLDASREIFRARVLAIRKNVEKVRIRKGLAFVLSLGQENIPASSDSVRYLHKQVSDPGWIINLKNPDSLTFFQPQLSSPSFMESGVSIEEDVLLQMGIQ